MTAPSLRSNYFRQKERLQERGGLNVAKSASRRSIAAAVAYFSLSSQMLWADFQTIFGNGSCRKPSLMADNERVNSANHSDDEMDNADVEMGEYREDFAPAHG